MRKLLLLGLGLLLLAGCDTDAPPAPESDSAQEYAAGSTVPVDDSVYELEGTVVGDVGSITRQTAPAEGHLSGANGYVGGTFFGPEMGGKGFVRLLVSRSSGGAGTRFAPEGAVVVLKASDTKAALLLPGDRAHFKCRLQYEALAAVRVNQSFDAEQVATWEFDYCRLAEPLVVPTSP